MRTTIILFTILFIPAVAGAGTINVPGDYTKIQDAIDAAVHGDNVLVAPGTYVEILDFKGKAIFVESSDGPEATVIDGNLSGQNVVTFKNGETPHSVLEGFTVTNGGSIYGGSYGGIYCLQSSPTITHNIITGNGTTYSLGAGIYCHTSSPVITHNTITGNTANHGGGIYGIYSSEPLIADNVISGNTAKGNGGAIVNYSSKLMIKDNIISGNSSKLGGGIYNSGTYEPVIQGNILSGNTAEKGGGMYFAAGQCMITLNTIVRNTATLEGGGIRITGGISVVNNIIAENMAADGGGIFSYYFESVMQGNTIVGNSAGNAGGGLYFWGGTTKPAVMNTILWNNSAPSGPGMWIGTTAAPTTVTISHCDVEGGEAWVHVEPGCMLNWGAGMIDVDPLFVDPANDDYCLMQFSLCIDAGDNQAPNMSETDIEGDPRIFLGNGTGLHPVGAPPEGGIVDLGADEYCLMKRTELIWK